MSVVNTHVGSYVVKVFLFYKLCLDNCVKFLSSRMICNVRTNLSDEFLNDGWVLRTVVGNFSELFLGVIQNMSYVIVTSLKHLQTSLKT